MSMQDQFKDKAERMKQQGKKKTRPEGRRPEGRQDEASRRSPAGRDGTMPESERAHREAQDRIGQDYDA
ncbi:MULTISPECIES: hypothetical protein [Streptomyces]|uniref:Uncharacterized protein n=1 Tax=Streptomyces triticiradicis TaxID=2651189 RepID=A0A7J5D4A8_9ACTN|nr:hypothetical protein [Streptomyces triticiradicis]KAB1977327.1 hypothetical protein F8144_42310 [Streptomyces triticiradicis]